MLLRAFLLIDNRTSQRRVNAALQKLGLLTDSTSSLSHLQDVILRESCDILVISRGMLTEDAGEWIRRVLELPDSPDIIVLTDREDSRERAKWLSQGCVAVLLQSLPAAALRSVIEAVLKRRKNAEPTSIDRVRVLGPPRLSDFKSASELMRSFMSVVERVAPSDATLLLLGETGVGKERLARAIHNDSARSKGPFVAVNCAALTESLLESELFGHEEGAFTGASRSRRGCFELAHSGTLFLDEIGEMPLHLQVKLLRALQEREVVRLGGEKPISVDVRVLAATNRDIENEVEQDRFRKDLFYRLSVVKLKIPSLSERREDIPSLVSDYIHYFSTRMTHQAIHCSKEAVDALIRYHWPGNIRELINVIERAMLLCQRQEIGLVDLPHEIKSSDSISDSVANDSEQKLNSASKLPLNEFLAQAERQYLVRLLETTGGRIGETARLAKIDPRVLYQKMKRLKLNKKDFG